MRAARGSQGWFLVLAIVVIVLLAWLVGRFFWAASAGNTVALTMVEVTRGVMEQDVRERGLVRPARVVPIQSEIMSNQARVIWLYEEGATVNRGLVVARFDTKPFMDALVRAEQDLVDAQASLEAAEKAVELHHEDAAAQVESAERSLTIARIKANDLRHGTGQLERQRLVQALERAERASALAREELQDLELLLERGHVSQRERDTVADRLLAAQEDLAMAERQLANFDRYEWPRKLGEADVLVEAAQTELDRVRRVSAVELQRLESEVVRRVRAFASAEGKLEDAKRDVANCDVRAPTDGVLLYRELSRSDGRRKIRIGDDVWMGQAFMEIPDTSALVVEASVREVDVAKLAVGMKADVELDALPGRSFAGEVEAIDPIAEADEERSYLRRFRTRVRLGETHPGMHPGMSAEVRIVHRRVEDALVLPVSAIVYTRGGPIARVWDPREGVRETPVHIGAVGNDWVEIKGGLREGQLVEVGHP